MANKIVLKKSSVASKVPLASDLDFGELALNYTDSKLYFKKADGTTIDSFSTAPAPVTSVAGKTGVVTLVKGDVGLANVDNTSDATKNAATAILTNKTISGSNNTISNISLSTGVTGTLPIANGGTGGTSFTANNVLLGNGTSAFQSVAPGTSGNVLTSNGTTWVSQAAGAALSGQTDSASPYETSLGSGAGSVNTGVNNTFIGYETGNDNTTGTNNTAVGFQALDANTTGTSHVVMGTNALGANTTGERNVAIGFEASLSTTTASDTVSIGYQAGRANTIRGSHVCIGSSAGFSNEGNGGSVFIGDSSGYSNTTGDSLVYIGHQAGYNQNGRRNTAVGAFAFYGPPGASGVENSVFGRLAGNYLSSGSQNTILGHSAAATGTNDLTTGSNNIIIGYNAEASSATVSNEVTIGNTSVNRFRVPGLGIDWTTSSIPGPSSMTKISTITCSAGAVATFTGLTGYDRYLLVFESLAVAATSNGIRYRLGYGSPVTYVTSGYSYLSIRNTSSTITGAAGATLTEGFLGIANSSATHVFSGSFMITGMLGEKTVGVTGNMSNQSLYSMTGHCTLNNPSSLSMTVLDIYSTNSTTGFTSGKVTLYGLS